MKNDFILYFLSIFIKFIGQPFRNMKFYEEFNDDFCYNIDKKLSKILNECIESGFEKYDASGYYSSITFKNGLEMLFWDSNKYYSSWMYQGEMKKDDKIIYKWSDKRPSIDNMYKIKKFIESIYPNNF